jgi:anaerobic selenocysteine-containing dehydrogenase
MTRTVRTNCPRDCYDGCGIVVTLAEGKKPRVAGDPEHPVARGSLCGAGGFVGALVAIENIRPESAINGSFCERQ